MDRPHDTEECVTIDDILNRVGDKWSVQVICGLGDGVLRFSELKRSIPGISQRMLTLTLRQLERDGLVQRTVYPTVPPKVEYNLSEFGRTILQPVTALAEWAIDHQADMHAAREAYDQLRVAAV